jgi:hypothetical protein
MSLFLALLLTLRSCTRSRAVRLLEVLALRHPLQVLQRSRPRRLRLVKTDRWLWMGLLSVWTEWRAALVIVTPETVIAWHRRGCRWFWTWKSRRRAGRPTAPADVRVLIRTMSQTNPRWGAPRIHGELLKLGIDVSQAPRYVVRDRDHASDGWAAAAKAMGIDEVLTAPRSPWQNAYVEQFIGSARRACLDPVIVLSATGRQRLMHLYCAYDERSRTHLSLNKDAPIPRPIAAPGDGRVVAIPQVGGLHHRYERQAA